VECGASDDEAEGSICFVANDTSTDEYMIVSAEHVFQINDSQYEAFETSQYHADHLLHPQSGEKLGDYSRVDGPHDAIAYSHRSDAYDVVSADTYESIPDISGYWTWSGIEEQLSGGGRISDVQLCGVNDSYRLNDAVYSSRSASLDHQVTYESDRGEGGDSGGIWIDQYGDLVSMHNGYRTDFYGNQQDIGACGEKILDGLDLYFLPLYV